MYDARKKFSFLPPQIIYEIEKSDYYRSGILEEVRCRIGQPYVLYSASGESALPQQVSGQDLDYIIERATNFSIHTCADEIKAGFLHTDSGCRIGLCGTVTDTGVRNITSISVRAAREVTGCAEPLLGALLKGGFQSTLILSPPGGGKTTLLRDLIRSLSEKGYRVSVADERGEIAAVHHRQPSYHLGHRSDVMTGGKKAQCCMMLLRSMNPNIIALDEITAPEDIEAIKYAAGCGVALLATAHAKHADALPTRPLYRELLNEKIFCRAVEIRCIGNNRDYRVVQL